MRNPPEFCANCGAPIPRRALACPECGADERTGWAETSIYDGLDLPPDEDTESEDERTRDRLRKKTRIVWIAAAVVTIAFAILLILGR